MEDLNELRELLGVKSIKEVVRRYFLTKEPICFQGDQDLVYELQKSLSDHFDVHTKDIEIVGSSKIGISLSGDPARRGKKFDEESDVDIVIVSSELFDRGWHELMNFSRQSHLFRYGDRDHIRRSFSNIKSGIISPDLLPTRMDFSQKWWEVFNRLSGQGKFETRDIRGRLFKDWWFAEHYYSIMLAKISSGEI